METIFRNGSDVKPNPFFNGEINLVESSNLREYIDSYATGKN
jgi:hypothetical protein